MAGKIGVWAFKIIETNNSGERVERWVGRLIIGGVEEGGDGIMGELQGKWAQILTRP